MQIKSSKYKFKSRNLRKIESRENKNNLFTRLRVISEKPPRNGISRLGIYKIITADDTDWGNQHCWRTRIKL